MKLTYNSFKERCVYQAKDKGFECISSRPGKRYKAWGTTKESALQNMMAYLRDEHGFTIITRARFN